MIVPHSLGILACLVVLLQQLQQNHLSQAISCGQFHDINIKRRGDENFCSQYAEKQDAALLMNLPILTGAHCNTKSGEANTCRILAGRLEFIYDVEKDKIVGPVEAGKFVAEGGIHERVPLSFTPNGEVLFNDRVINWARLVYTAGNEVRLNLLNVNQFNWCKYASTNNWPYRSAFRDEKSNGRYLVYFYNRQSCIVDTQNNDAQHFNTRFLYNSSLRIDLDYNPVIFPFRDPILNGIRLVKHMRQHWYEVDYEVLDRSKLGSSGLKYFVRMDSTESEQPGKVHKRSGPFIGREAYRPKSDLCLSNYYQMRTSKNGKLLEVGCGHETIEIADKIKGTSNVFEVGLHSIPRFPKETQSFFGVDVSNDADWVVFAKDKLSFSATTTKPTSGSANEVEVFMLYSEYKGKVPDYEYDEFYPLPKLSRYIAKRRGDQNWDVSDRGKKEKVAKNLNYVDDIAYLHGCKTTILVIFGPLYTEIQVDDFENLDKPTLIRPINELGLFEITNSFFADHQTEDTLYFFHRLNYVAKHEYKCGAGDGKSLVTAKKVENYYRVSGANQVPNLVIFQYNDRMTADYSEEEFFRRLGVTDAQLPQADAPDPSLFSYEKDQIFDAKPVDTSWAYYVAGAVALIVIILAIICMLTLRATRKRRHHRRGGGVLKTHRSGMSSISSSQQPSLRSGLGRQTSKTRTAASLRSGLSAAHGSSGGKVASRRSSLGKTTLHPGSNTSTHRSNLSSGKNAHSGSGTSTHRSSLSAGKNSHHGSKTKTRRSNMDSTKTLRPGITSSKP